MVDAVIANQTHVVVGEETETMQSADIDNPKKGGHVEDNVTSGLQAIEPSSPSPPSPSSQKEDGDLSRTSSITSRVTLVWGYLDSVGKDEIPFHGEYGSLPEYNWQLKDL